MRFIRRFPRKVVKSLLFIILIVGVFKLFWMSTTHMVEQNSVSYQQKKLTGNGSGGEQGDFRNALNKLGDRFKNTFDDFGKNVVDFEIFDKNGGKKEPEEKFCSKIVPFSTGLHNTISTFDLPDKTDYSKDERGRYKIPDEFFTKHNASLSDKHADDIRVIIVPFSHSDPGYGNTFEGYYQGSTKNVLNNMIEKLTKYPNMTFQWAEAVFLERWFRDITDTQKQKVRDLVKRGQLEIVLGGWVMPDEAITYYVPVVDQMIEGHHWIQENIGVKPSNAWINDPFGYSSTMPYLWRNSGMDNMVILRIHQAIKHTLMSMRSMEFKWRPYWAKGDDNDILTNLMPYPGYWNSDVCGPDQSVCKQFNFLHLGSNSDATAVTKDNIDKLAQQMFEAYKFTAGLYKYNNLVIFIGEDNSYNTASAWEDTYINYDKLMTHINNNPKWNMKVKFGTLKEYFSNVRETEAKYTARASRGVMKGSQSFPTLSGDFFPYSDWEDGYWTGYYTTRPWVKKFSREIGPIVRAADIFSVILFNHCVVSKQCNDIKAVYKEISRSIRTARRELGMYQHHDGITGTALPYVVQDYEARLLQAYQAARKALKMTLMLIMSRGKVNDENKLADNQHKQNAKNIMKNTLHNIGSGGLNVLIANPLEKQRVDMVDILVDRKNVHVLTEITETDIEKETKRHTEIPVQITKQGQNGGYLVSFEVELAPFSVQKYVVKESKVDSKNIIEETTKHSESLEIENSFLKVIFDPKTGMLDRLVDKNGKSTKLSSEFLKYTAKNSGAYLFNPSGPPADIQELKTSPQIVVTRGPILSEVKVMYSGGISKIVRLYNTSGIQGHGIHIKTEVNMNKGSYSNAEIIFRLKTDLKNDNIFFTDQNGFQLMGRRNYPERLIESNYYPITTMAILEDDVKRMTLHVTQPHGVASLQDGWLEVMLDRTMSHDDGKGLGQGVYDKTLTLSEFIIQVEHKTEPGPIVEARYTSMTGNSMIMSEQFQNGLQIFAVADDAKESLDERFASEDEDPGYPCDVAIVGLRNLHSNDLSYNGTSLVLHRRPVHCAYPVDDLSCPTYVQPTVTVKSAVTCFHHNSKSKITETSLSHMHSKTDIALVDDIRPDINELKSYLIKPAP